MLPAEHVQLVSELGLGINRLPPKLTHIREFVGREQRQGLIARDLPAQRGLALREARDPIVIAHRQDESSDPRRAGESANHGRTRALGPGRRDDRSVVRSLATIRTSAAALQARRRSPQRFAALRGRSAAEPRSSSSCSDVIPVIEEARAARS
jgi:hypothetical protein